MPVSFLPMVIFGLTAKDVWTLRIGELLFLVMVTFIIAICNITEDLHKSTIKNLEYEKDMYKDMCYNMVEKQEKDKYGF